MNVWAPGRVNLIGEHTDYSGGLVLPVAIDLGLSVEIHAATDHVELTSTSFGVTQPFAANGSGPRAKGWARFGQAVAAELNALGRPAIGASATISSTLPAGIGLSSSAALEVAIALTLCAVADYEVGPLELAQACQRAEWRAVGVPCGVLDQLASLLGEPNAAILIDCASMQHRAVPVPAGAALLVIDSGIKRQLEHTGYADRRRELTTALTTLGASDPRMLTQEDLEPLEPVLKRRLRHVITENQRVTRFAAALESEDLRTAGNVLSESHVSLRDDYDVSLPEIDKLVAAAEARGALGARLHGGGFGGTVLALAEASASDAIADAMNQIRPARPTTLRLHPSRGACIAPARRQVERDAGPPDPPTTH